MPRNRAPQQDSTLLSLLRGRLLGAAQAVVIAIIAGRSFWAQTKPLLPDGVTLDELAMILQHSSVMLDAWSAAYIAVSAIVIAILNWASKRRERRRASRAA